MAAVSKLAFKGDGESLSRWLSGENAPAHESAKEMKQTLGRCCVCDKGGPLVRNVLMFKQVAPVRGTGWGCVVCGLKNDGAVAVVCDPCLAVMKADKLPVKFVCVGAPFRNERLATGDLKTPAFDHDLSKHPEVIAARQ
jgi:hypothetical protein